MIKIRILSPGKSKESWLQEAISEYEKRLQAKAKFDWLFFKDEDLFFKSLQIEKQTIYLDPLGEEMTSLEFSNYLFKTVEKEGASLSFAIGGPDGFSKEFLKNKPTLSLSKMTLTHQMTRLFLIEQIYRAFEIEKGSNYNR